AKIVKRGNAVRLGPDSNSARSGNAVVVDLDVELAVERHPDSLSHELDAQRMPLVLRNRGIHVLDRVSASVLRVVQRNVVLQGVGPCDVVVVAILPPPNKSACLVLLA